MIERESELLCRAADYQFGRGGGEALFHDVEELAVTHTSSGRPRQVAAEDGRLVSYGNDGRFTLGVTGGRRLHEAFDAPRNRVVVGDESEPFVRDGRNVFAKFVDEADEAIRPGDEVLVVHEDGRLLAVGRSELAGAGMLDFETGMAVKVRDAVGEADV
jgi:uncharacterized protein with predicted RNA binding PUA domain